MRIVYVSDLSLPRTATDSEQAVNMVAALGAAGATVDLVLPRRWGAHEPTLDTDDQPAIALCLVSGPGKPEPHHYLLTTHRVPKRLHTLTTTPDRYPASTLGRNQGL